MPAWWQRLTTIDPVLKVCLLIFQDLDKVGIPLILYNNIPSRTGTDLGADLIMELCEKCPSIAGLKPSNGDLDQITKVIY